MDDIRMTIRLSLKDAQMIDMFVKTGEFATRSEYIRHAVREYSQNHMESIIKKVEAMEKLQKMVNNIEAMEEYNKK